MPPKEVLHAFSDLFGSVDLSLYNGDKQNIRTIRYEKHRR